jgi:uncharacterized protein YjlB
MGTPHSGQKQLTVQTYLLRDDGVFPNNSRLPLLHYQGALPRATIGDPGAVRALFERNGWGNAWVNGVYGYDHYHSPTHEVLGVVRGEAVLQLGGPTAGVKVTVTQGDVLLIPAGVAHRNLETSPDFQVVGAYPQGRTYDMKYGRPEERPGADKSIAAVDIPYTDPVYGAGGAVARHWGKREKEQ